MQVTDDSYYYVIAELCLASPFVLALLMMVGFERFRSKKGSKRVLKSMNEASCQLSKQLEADLSVGGPAKVLATWRTIHLGEIVSPKALKVVVQAFLEMEPESLVTEIAQHIDSHWKLRTQETVVSVLDIMARVGQIKVMEDFMGYMRQYHHIRETEQINDIFLGGFAFAGQIEKVCDLKSRMRSNGNRISPRGYCLMVKGFVKNDMTDIAWEQLKEMHRHGLAVPSFAVTKICRLASNANGCVALIADIDKYSIPISSPDVSILLKDCQKRDDLKAAFRVEELARLSKAPLTIHAYDAFLMLCVSHGDITSFRLFEELQQIGTPSPGLCLGLIARCPESKFCRFADMMADHLRKSNDMTIQAYIALMKVYANCGLYNEACDLYAQIVKEGLQPDSVMYGCLINFAVACGRTELAQELSRVAPQLHIQNYMPLLKAAVRDKNIERAFGIVEEMKNSGVTVDITAYSCVLDACAQAGDMTRARSLLKEMQETGSVDVVAYNTVLKGYCKSGDSVAAMAIVSEMDAAGVQPNDVSFNCLINATATSGDFKEAWSLVEMMERRGLRIDNYTMSILMKVLKKARYPHSKDISKAFALLDRSGVDMFGDEILLNVVLETCTRHRQFTRLETIFSRCMESKRRPSMHTTGLLIKASGMLKRTDTCRELWKELTENRKMAPNDYVLGYMLDALVNNHCVDEAVILLKTWESKVSPSAYLYTTILKGLANIEKTDEAMLIYMEMKEKASKISTGRQPH
jgi:pentatricopeptide repeat protein